MLTPNQKELFTVLLREKIQACKDQIEVYEKELADLEPGSVPVENGADGLGKYYRVIKPKGKHKRTFEIDYDGIFMELFGKKQFRAADWKDVADYFKIDGPVREDVRGGMNNWIKKLLAKDLIVKSEKNGEIWWKWR